ncbi:response regulator transcription factor [Rhizosphaericola mali]|uniref:Response regulator transcription factor n=1 Tax=Rhizosphaericola mali TaxID=2545455 RepID=A0A5P2G649_9BACT|nr:response regulator transcription factor [Rhizosphaericola mali]QES89372.1 response regulator transcription factor [Rhizosphaericola mali]
MLTLGVADSDTLYRSTLISEICVRSDRKVLFCAANGLELIEDQQNTPADILIVELYMPVISGVEAIKVLQKRNKYSKILAISAIFQPEMPKLLQDLRVNGYCSKIKEDVVVAMEILQKGGTYFDGTYFQKWEKDGMRLIKEKHTPSLMEELKSVEINIIQHTCEGKSNKEIGDILSLSKRTIDTYTRDLLLKLNLKTKIELVNYAMKHGVCRTSCQSSDLGYCACKSLFVKD